MTCGASLFRGVVPSGWVARDLAARTGDEVKSLIKHMAIAMGIALVLSACQTTPAPAPARGRRPLDGRGLAAHPGRQRLLPLSATAATDSTAALPPDAAAASPSFR